MNAITKMVTTILLAATASSYGQLNMGSAVAGLKDLLAGRSATQVEESPAAPALPPYDGPRLTVGVGEFRNQAGYRHQLGENMRSMLESALGQCGRFTVLNRTTLASHLREIQLAQSGWAEGNPGAARAGRIKQAVFLIEGDLLTANEQTSRSRNDARLGPLSGKLGGDTATIKIRIKAADTSSSEILVDKVFTGRAGHNSLMLGVDMRKLDLGFGREARQPMDEAAYDVIGQAVNALALTMEGRAASTAPREIQVSVEEALADTKEVIVKPGAKAGLANDQEITFAGPKNKYGLSTGAASCVRVVEVSDDFARCTLQSGPLPSAATTAKLVLN